MNKYKSIFKRRVQLFGLLAINFLASGSFVYGQDDTMPSINILTINDKYPVDERDHWMYSPVIGELYSGIHIKKNGILDAIIEGYYGSESAYYSIEMENTDIPLINEGLINFEAKKTKLFHSFLYEL